MKSYPFPWVVSLALAAWLVGCGDPDNPALDDRDPDPPDAAVGPPDAAPTPDADLPDAGVAPDPDASPPDAEVTALPDMAPLADAAMPPPMPASVQTRLGLPSTLAGRGNRVTCEVLDEEGGPVDGVATRFEVRPPTGWSRPEPGEDGVVPPELIGEVAGVYQVTCLAPTLGLRDDTASRWDVLPGAPARLRAEAEPEASEAGETVEITCEALDAAGNPVPLSEAVVVISPEDPANEVVYPDPEEGGPVEITFTRSGRYTIACAYKDATSEIVAEVEVSPGPPAELLASLFPDRPLYPVGGVVEMVTLVTDRYGNTIPDAPLSWGAEPHLNGFGGGRFRPAVEGRYRLGVTVEGPTDGDRPLSQWLDLIVDAGGPVIRCEEPSPGTQLRVAAGRNVVLEGQVSDVAGVERLTVDGRPVDVGADGSFLVNLGVPDWGLNLHQIVAEDAGGSDNSVWCTFFASPEYAFEQDPIDDVIRLALAREAIDDGAPERPVTSLGDLFRAVVVSDSLVDTLDQSLRAQNPVVPTTCQTRILGQCVFSIGAEYQSLAINGARTTSLEPIDDGLRARLRLNDVVLGVQLRGTLGNRGTIRTNFIEAVITFDLRVVRGQPRISVREVESLRVGAMDADFDGVITGSLLNLIFDAFESLIRNLVTQELQSFLEQELDSLLTDLLSGFDVAALSAAFPIPDPAGGPPVPITVAVGLSSVVADPEGLSVGVSTQTAGRIGEGSRSLGVPMPPMEAGCAPAGSSPPARPRNTSATIQVAFLNQMLHQVWRAGLFRLDVGEALADGVEADFRLRAPPAAELPGGLSTDLRIHFGPLEGSLGYEGLFDEPITFSMSAILRVPVALEMGPEGPTLALGGGDGIVIDAFALDFPVVTVSAQARPNLESVLLDLVESLVLQGLAESLPSLPIPDFALPDDLADFGIPAGTRLGVQDPRLRTLTGCWLLEGSLGR